MKTSLTSSLASLILGLGTVLAQTGGAGAPTAPVPVPSPNPAAAPGLMLENGVVYLVRGSMATRLESSAVPAGQMITADGSLTPAPETSGTAVSPTGTVTPNPKVAAGLKPVSGVIFKDGVPFVVRSGAQAERLDETLLPADHFLPMTGGAAVPAPKDVTGLQGSASVPKVGAEKKPAVTPDARPK